MLPRQLFALFSLLLPVIFSPVATAQWTSWPPRPRTNLTQCMLDIRNHTLAYDPFLVGPGEQQTSNPLEAIGADYNTCEIYCGDSSEAFTWSTFSPQFQGWLLPFLALLAQLPYESDGTWHDIMSLMLTVGSPLLATYSLALTILNSRHLKQRLDEAFPDGDDIRLMDLKKNIFHTLQLSQQEPFRVGSLDAYSLEMGGGRLKDAELHWWNEAQKVASSRKRWFTASLATQALSAIIAFSFTWVDAFGSENIGTAVTAFGLAISLCWSWTAVIVLGWYFAGVSVSNNPISEAIEQANRLHHDSFPRLARFTAPKGPEYVALSRRIAGDVEHAGPLYNYAKAFVWTNNIDHLVETLRNQILGRPTVTTSSFVTVASVTQTEDGAPAVIPPPSNADGAPSLIPPPSNANAPTTAASSEISSPEILPRSEHESSYRYYQPKTPETRGSDGGVVQRMLWSAVSAIALNVATVGSAFWLDFLTPSMGLGCRSGGVLIYWMISYGVWMLMVGSASLSNLWCAHVATYRIEKSQPSSNLRLLGFVAVLLRLLGKGLAILNSAWIITHCLFEFTSFYNRCLCETNFRTAPWVWLDDAAIRSLDNVQDLWYGLAFLTGVVCTGYISFIGLWTKTRL